MIWRYFSRVAQKLGQSRSIVIPRLVSSLALTDGRSIVFSCCRVPRDRFVRIQFRAVDGPEFFGPARSNVRSGPL